ncbi:MAG: histidinol dehydrogenase [Bacteroidetes bacterium]|nr:histidinol dehydrogenase [Rhodothermia bacterium]MCS7155527.1 histidinol dehydrogenase [Bacteroidota bacterium]MCX7907380.1 histidinol dehydrogenase [Bacteroidota bacterium]MDW8138374.1 histidinol dehydrogenase [Bacteroidota bacterium]MDW8284689.1 histidinol dehydrogenase [Bacteroidota bacterium]
MLPIFKGSEVAAFLGRRRRRWSLQQQELRKTVEEILEAVRREGDAALRRLSRQLDGVEPQPLRMPAEYLQAAWRDLDPALQEAIDGAIARVRRFHEAQRPTSSWIEPEPGVLLGQRWTALGRVGVYAPGGKAAYPSSVWMSVIPAQVAGVLEIALASPPDPTTGRVHPLVAAVAWRLGLEEVYAVGGAQAIAALALGTDSIRAVDKIVGPGNAYVAAAKQLLYGQVGIDQIAGPSEIVVLADDTARADWVLADLLSQAEHDEQACAVLITPSEPLAQAVQRELWRRWPNLERRAILERSLRQQGACLVVEGLREAVAVSNELAPEHLQLYVADPWSVLPYVRHAGAVFLGPYSPEPIGDYWAGPSHVLPTGGSARFASGLSVWDFLKRSSVIAYDQEALARAAPFVIRLARAEGLPAHAEAVQARLTEPCP